MATRSGARRGSNSGVNSRAARAAAQLDALCAAGRGARVGQERNVSEAGLGQRDTDKITLL